MDLLRKEGKVKDQEARGLIFRNSNTESESNRELRKCELYEPNNEEMVIRPPESPYGI